MPLLVQLILTILIAMFLVYVAVELRAQRQGGRKAVREKEKQCPSPTGEWPAVSVLLPIYNEKLVVEKLINAVCALDYPHEKLEILVLDDSTDETGEIARQAIEKFPYVNIRKIRRPNRIGYKAGNLNFGLKSAKGDFIAIFDADCLPPADFLRRVMPRFADEKVGFLQTGIAYWNANATFLTRFQAMEASHKETVTSGFAEDGFMASLTGSSCVWRRACIEDIGGISPETITEDVDMGYAAQLRKWTYVYPRDVVSWAELPEAMASFRVQRQRWARGMAHNAARHSRDVFTSPMGWLARIHAITLVFSPLLLALFYLLLLICPLVAWATPHLGLFFNVSCAIFLVAAAIWGWANTSGTAPAKTPVVSLVTRITLGVAYVLIFFPLSLYYFSAIIQTALMGRGEFHSTPKGCGRKRMAHPRINTILLGLEIFSILYALWCIYLAWAASNYWVILYAGLAFSGFAMTLFFSFSDSRKKVAAPQSVLIAGASGAIGQALALEYASPGVRLILQGRDCESLARLAEACAAKGASIRVKTLDLRDADAAYAWAQSLNGVETPDLFIACAGLNTNIGKNWEGELYQNSKALVEVNLLSVIATVEGLLPAMRKRKSGQIALVSSLAGYYGLPEEPTYCATKAAVRSYGNSLRGWLAREGINVNVILPGYVSSPMCDAMPGPKPFLWRPKRAAAFIRKGLERDLARISFPFPLNLGVWCLSVIPPCLAIPIARILGYGR